MRTINVGNVLDNLGEFYIIVEYDNVSYTSGYIRVVESVTDFNPTIPDPIINDTPPTDPTAVSVTINGILQSFEVSPQIIDDRTMLPLRATGKISTAY